MKIDLGPGARTAGAEDPRLLVSSAEDHHERLADGLEVGLVPHSSVERQDRGDVETRGAPETRRGWRRLRPARRSGRRGRYSAVTWTTETRSLRAARGSVASSGQCRCASAAWADRRPRLAPDRRSVVLLHVFCVPSGAR